MIIDNKINQSRLSDDVVNNQTEYYYESGVIKSQKINQSVPCEDDGVLKANGSKDEEGMQVAPPIIDIKGAAVDIIGTEDGKVMSFGSG